MRRDLHALANRVTPCPWLAHRARLRLYPHVAASHAAYNQDHAQLLAKTGAGLPPRQVVIDESPPLFDETVITLDSLSQWLAKNSADAAYPPEGMAPATWAALNGNLDTALRALARWLGTHPDTANHRLTAAELDLPQLIDTLAAFPRALDGLRPEAVLKDSHGARCVVPLRALEDLKQALELGTAWIHHGQLHLLVPTRWVREVLAKTRPVTLTDATPRLLLRTLADAYHPLPVATPHLSIQLHTGRLHGKGSAKDPRELEDLVRELERRVEQAGPGRVGVLTHKTLAAQVRRRVKQGQVRGWRPEEVARIGWFGCHDRGQNAWRDLTVLIQWGLHRPAPVVMERLYEAERALAGQAGVSWQPWSNARTEQWWALPYRAADGSGLELAAKLPDNPDQAAWERDGLTATTVQVIGRLRAVQRPDQALEVHIHTHYPLAGHGLWLDQVHAPGPRAGGQQSRAQWRQDVQDNCRARFELARAEGAQSRRTINQFLQDQGLPTLGAGKYQELLAAVLAETPEATAGESLAAAPAATAGAVVAAVPAPTAGEVLAEVPVATAGAVVAAVPAPTAGAARALAAALDRLLDFLHAGPLPAALDALIALVLLYAARASGLDDRRAGLLLARVLELASRLEDTPTWTSIPSQRGPDVPLRPG
ncbi:MAG TPA: hypothetical protein VEG33_14875 [Streptosporangiaceae bacterium]|nr:hypothetical protein [Streptosporangiaceae bacterium]